MANRRRPNLAVQGLLGGTGHSGSGATGRADRKERLLGAYAESQHLPWFNVNAFYFGLNDQELQNKNLHRTYSTYGLRLFKSPATNEFDYEFEGAIQTGRLGNVEHFAYNPNAEAGYTFNLPWTPRLLAQYAYSSGSRTPGGSQDGNFDPLFGARRFDLMPTGNFGAFFGPISALPVGG